MTDGSCRQYGAVATAAEILCSRWTMVVLREMVAGATRFNDLRRGLPRISPSLLSKRLKDLEQAGVVERRPVAGAPQVSEYHLTPTGWDVQPVVEAMGRWGRRWVHARPSLRDLDPGLLMWDMQRHLDRSLLPRRKLVIAFLYPEVPGTRGSWWLIVEPGQAVDLSAIDPGLDVDLHVVAELRTLMAIWMRLTSVQSAAACGKLRLVGEPRLADAIERWLEAGSDSAAVPQLPG